MSYSLSDAAHRGRAKAPLCSWSFCRGKSEKEVFRARDHRPIILVHSTHLVGWKRRVNQWGEPA
jgi:hypothetical protein